MLKDKIKSQLIKIAATLVKKAAGGADLFRTGTRLWGTGKNINKLNNGSLDFSTASAAANTARDAFNVAGQVPSFVNRGVGALAAPVSAWNAYTNGTETMNNIRKGDYVAATDSGLDTVVNGIGAAGGLEALLTGGTTLSGPAVLGAGTFAAAKGLTDLGMERWGTPAIEENLKGQENGKGATDMSKTLNSNLNAANNYVNDNWWLNYNPVVRGAMALPNFMNGLSSSNPYVGENGEIIVPNFATQAGQTVQQMGRGAGAIAEGLGEEFKDDFAGKRQEEAIRNTRERNARYQAEQAAAGRESEIAQDTYRAEQWEQERLKQQQAETAYNQRKAQQAANRGKIPAPLTKADQTRLQELDYVPNQITDAPVPSATLPSGYMQETGFSPDRFASQGQFPREALGRRVTRAGSPNSNTPVFPADFGKQFEGQPITYETLANIYTDIYKNNNPTSAQKKVTALKQFGRQNGFDDGKQIGEIARAQAASSTPARAQAASSTPAQNQLTSATRGPSRTY